MPQQPPINSPRQGMIGDTHHLNVQQGQYTYALNASVEANSQDGNFFTLQNDGSNVLATLLPAGFHVIGHEVVVEQNRTLFFLTNPQTGASMIGEVLDCPYDDNAVDSVGFSSCAHCTFEERHDPTPLEQVAQAPYCPFHIIIEADCLNFSLNHPVRSRHKVTDCGLNLYFTDDYNQRRFVYFDYEGADPRAYLKLQDRFKVVSGYINNDCHQPIYQNALDCNKIKYHPCYEVPCITSVDVIKGGELKAGVVQAMICYSDRFGNPLTEYFPSINPVPIFSHFITFETNYKTDKALKINVQNLDQTFLYTHYNVVVAETVDNFTEFKLLGTYPVSQSNVLYTGNEENLARLTPEDVFQRRAFYSRARNITSAGGHLFFSDLTEFSKPNLQRVANGVKLYWQTVAIPEAVYNQPEYTERFRSYMRDEVYALGMEFITCEGEVLGTYHIPGPSKAYLSANYNLNVDAPVANDDVINRNKCAPEENCCGGNILNATVSLSCSDVGCTETGEVTATITFDKPTPAPITLEIGFIQATGNGKFAYGWDIYTVPADATKDTTSYASQVDGTGAGDPMVIPIPQGVTTHTEVNVKVKNWDTTHAPAPGNTASLNLWTCHSCQTPITDIWVKTASPDAYQVELTTTENYTIHTVAKETTAEEGCVDCSTPTWKVYNTAFVVDAPHNVLDQCHDTKLWEWGEFAYWESSERYPNDPVVWGELCGTPIRHHRFPDSTVTHIHDSKDGTKGFSDRNLVLPVGVRVDHQSVKNALAAALSAGIITQADRDRITAYRIVRGNRVGQKSVLAKGLLFDMWNYQKHGRTYYYPNYPYNDLRQDYFISNDPNTYKLSNTSSPIPHVFSATGRYTFHSPDIHFHQEAVGSELKLEALEYGQSEGYFNRVEDEAKHKLLSTAAMTLALAAGVAAAFSSEKEKKCKTVTLYNVTSATVTGGINTGTLAMLAPNEVMGYEELTGLPIADPQNAASAGMVNKTYCKGSTFQLLNLASGNPAGAFFQQAVYLGIIALREMQIILDLIKALAPYKNYAVQHNSVGRYVNYKTVPNGQGVKIREIVRGGYLDPIMQVVDESTTTTGTTFTTSFINNWHRERSLYLRIDPSKKLPNPSVQDTSRYTMSNVGLSYEDLNKRVLTDVSSYYASMKNYVPDQYGTVGNVEYLPTGACALQLDQTYALEATGVYGGDTFINRFALKRKMPFFLQTRVGMPNDIDSIYTELGNVGYPNYFLNTDQPLVERMAEVKFSLRGSSLGGAYQRLLGVPHTRFDLRKSPAFYQEGHMYLFSYGIPYFLVESDVNVDLRHGQNNLEKDFYPHQSDLDFWLQEKNIPIREDNYFFYNRSYSKQNKEAYISRQVLELPKDCKITHPSRVIQSEEDQRDSRTDRWLVFKANNTKDYPASNGRILGLDGIEDDKVLVRFENTSKIFGAYAELNTDEGSIAVGNGGVFNARSRDLAVTTLGFAGSQHCALLQTEFGHLWVDAKRGQVLLLGTGGGSMDELAKDGMKNWLKENLPFQLLRDFPSMALTDCDNNYKGLGLHLAFDKRFSRLFLTKLDYRKRGNVTYNAETKKFFVSGVEVSLGDPRYFDNRSWTLSYNFLTKGWTSFHSFTPNYYLETVDYIQSGINGAASSLWSHNVTNKSYQVYYGTLYPFTVEVVPPAGPNGMLHSVTYLQDALRYQGEYDWVYNRKVTFNKAILYNENQCSGELALNVREEDNLQQSIRYPFTQDNQIQILVTNLDGTWQFNQFWDSVAKQTAGLPIFKNKPSNAEKVLNLSALNYFKPDALKAKLRGRQHRLRLTNDQHSNYKFLLHLIQQQTHDA